MKTHELKSWPDFFELVYTGAKTFELRVNDRNFHVDDTVQLREFDDRKGVYTGREIKKRITYIADGVGPDCITPLKGLSRGYAILALGEL